MTRRLFRHLPSPPRCKVCHNPFGGVGGRLVIPGISGPHYRRRAVEAAVDLLRGVGYGSPQAPWLALAAAVNAGVAYVGNVGAAGVVDFTALGDPINVAARLQAEAAAGEILVAEDNDDALVAAFPSATRRTFKIRGHDEPVAVLILSA